MRKAQDDRLLVNTSNGNVHEQSSLTSTGKPVNYQHKVLYSHKQSLLTSNTIKITKKRHTI